MTQRENDPHFEENREELNEVEMNESIIRTCRWYDL